MTRGDGREAGQTCCTASTPGHEVAEQVLDAALERGGRGRAARAGALHVEEDGAFLEALEGDVAAIHGHGRAHAGGEQFLDHFDGLAVFFVEELIDLVDSTSAPPSTMTGLPERKWSMIDAENGRLDMGPVGVVLGHRDEIGTEEHAGDARNARTGRAPAANCRRASALRKSRGSPTSTSRPGRNFRVAGLGVASVWMNIGRLGDAIRTLLK